MTTPFSLSPAYISIRTLSHSILASFDVFHFQQRIEDFHHIPHFNHIVKQGAVLFVRSAFSSHALSNVLTYFFSSERFFSFMRMDKNYARSVIQIYAISRSSDGWLTLTEVLVTQEY